MQQSVQCFEYSYLCWYNRDIAGGTTRIVFIVIVLHFMTESKAEFFKVYTWEEMCCFVI